MNKITSLPRMPEDFRSHISLWSMDQIGFIDNWLEYLNRQHVNGTIMETMVLLRKTLVSLDEELHKE